MSTPTPKFQNGDVVKDVVTGYTGMIIATTLWLNGCYRYVIQSQTLHKETGKPIENESFDQNQLELLEAGVFRKAAKKDTTHETGGPRPDVTRGGTVRRGAAVSRGY